MITNRTQFAQPVVAKLALGLNTQAKAMIRMLLANKSEKHFWCLWDGVGRAMAGFALVTG